MTLPSGAEAGPEQRRSPPRTLRPEWVSVCHSAAPARHRRRTQWSFVWDPKRFVPSLRRRSTAARAFTVCSVTATPVTLRPPEHLASAGFVVHVGAHERAPRHSRQNQRAVKVPTAAPTFACPAVQRHRAMNRGSTAAPMRVSTEAHPRAGTITLRVAVGCRQSVVFFARSHHRHTSAESPTAARSDFRPKPANGALVSQISVAKRSPCSCKLLHLRPERRPPRRGSLSRMTTCLSRSELPDCDASHSFATARCARDRVRQSARLHLPATRGNCWPALPSPRNVPGFALGSPQLARQSRDVGDAGLRGRGVAARRGTGQPRSRNWSHVAAVVDTCPEQLQFPRLYGPPSLSVRTAFTSATVAGSMGSVAFRRGLTSPHCGVNAARRIQNARATPRHANGPSATQFQHRRRVAPPRQHRRRRRV